MNMDIYQIAMCILLPIALSMGYAFRKHNEELQEHDREEQEEYYKFVKENWMYLDGGDDNE